MKWFYLIKWVMVLCLFSMFTSSAFSETLPKPWIKFHIDTGTATEYFYNPKEVSKSSDYIEVNIMEILIPKALITHKHIKFDRKTGFRGYGDVSVYKNNTNNLVNKFNFAQGGYQFSKPNPEEKKLYKIIMKK